MALNSMYERTIQGFGAKVLMTPHIWTEFKFWGPILKIRAIPYETLGKRYKKVLKEKIR